MKKWILTAIVFLATVFCLGDNAHATMYSITQITNNSVNDSEPMINDSGQVIWVNGSQANTDVFLYDPSTGATTNISNLGEFNRSPQINSQGKVVWVNSTWGPEGPNYNTSQIYLYDPNNVPLLKPITSDGYNGAPQLNDLGQVVWQHGLFGPTRSIFLYDIGAETPTPPQIIASGTGSLINNLGQVVYRGASGILLYDIASETEKFITNQGYNYQINNLGQMVWQTSTGGDTTELIFYDPIEGPTQFTNNSRADIDPQINDLGQVVYRYRYGSSGYDIHLYDYVKGTYTAIGGDFSVLPQINNSGQIVWVEDRGLGRGTEIYYYDPTTKDDYRLTNNFTWDGGAQINNSGQIVWVGFPDGNSTDSEIFLASPGPATTPSGPGVSLDILVTDTDVKETPITITFDEVTTGGETTVTTTTSSPPLPAGFKVGDPPTYFEIETSATFTENIEVCISYASIYYGDPNNIRLFHDDGAGGWEDITSSNDTTKRIICGTTTHFSLFAILESSIACPSDPVSLGSEVSCSYSLYNPAPITSALWSWGDDSDSPGSIIPGDPVPTQIIGNHTYLEPGVYAVKLSLDGGAWIDNDRYVVIYDPEGGFVTGGGWINSPAGAYALDPDLSGKATFGFVSKYQKGSPYPVGNTEFQFRAADFTFHSGDYEWLRVAGPKAIFKGTGTINGAGEYGFMLFAIDGALNGGGGADKFRIQIWEKATDSIIYDNEINTSDNADPSTPIGGGSIVIHQENK